MSLSNTCNLLGRAPKVTAGSGGVGNVSGPASSTDTAIVRWSGTTGKIIQDSGVLINASNQVIGVAGSVGAPSFTFSGRTTDGWYSSASGVVALTSAGVRSWELLSAGSAARMRYIGPTGNVNFMDFQDSGGIALNAAGTNQSVFVTPSGVGGLTISTKINSYNGINTAGWGAEIIQAANEVTAQAAANASIATYTVGAADGTFRVSAQLDCTAATVLSTSLFLSYTDKGNTARTMIFPVAQLAGSFIAAGAITGTGAWETPVMHIRCKASTAITVGTSAGTFNTVLYSADAVISQVA